jgi:glutathione S-transferase
MITIFYFSSHAICTYLITKYAKDDTLYPTDPYRRAQVDQALHFDSGVLFARLRFLCVRRKSFFLSFTKKEFFFILIQRSAAHD